MRPSFETRLRRSSGRGRSKTQAVGGTSHLQRRDVDPAALLPALESGLGELHALGAFGERPFERRALVEMADEDLPFGLEAVVVIIARDLAPGLEEFDRLRDVGVPHRPRRVYPRLAPAFLQPGDRRAQGAVDVEGD